MVETSPAPIDSNLRITCARQLQNSLSHIKYQLRVTLRHFSRQPLQDFYREVRRGLDEVQYKPSWLPDNNAKVLVGNYNQVIKGLRTFHQDLQKFAMAIEAMIKDEGEEYKNVKILEEIESYMIQLLCEVEAALISLGCERPYAVQRSIMPEEDRHPSEETRRLVRDWGILSKYRTYLTKRRQELLNVIRARRKH
ncbi:uncharacterized protein [Anabrus simplex]|uniref:uncharacterized protein n=1 Tax=Anabrus simplex TaxID=316456 RepID=UPI0035A2E8C4